MAGIRPASAAAPSGTSLLGPKIYKELFVEHARPLAVQVSGGSSGGSSSGGGGRGYQAVSGREPAVEMRTARAVV